MMWNGDTCLKAFFANNLPLFGYHGQETCSSSDKCVSFDANIISCAMEMLINACNLGALCRLDILLKSCDNWDIDGWHSTTVAKM